MRISRKRMAEIIKRGESVVINGQIYSSIESLPSEAELAIGNEAQEKVAKENLEAQVAELQAQLALLEKSKEESKKSDKDVKDAVKEDGKKIEAEGKDSVEETKKGK